MSSTNRNERNRRWRNGAGKHYSRDRHYRKTYGIPYELFLMKKAEQLDCCELCSASFGEVRPVLDHDHVSGGLRSVLCDPCNTALGVAENRGGALWLERAGEYLRRWGQKHAEWAVLEATA